MSASEQDTPSKLQFSMDGIGSETPITPANTDNSASLSVRLEGETDEESVDGKVICLAATAKKDAELTAGWDDHTSDEEEYVQKEDADEDEDETGESEAELDCVDHDRCIEKGASLYELLKLQNMKHKGSKKEAKSALVGVICDHFQFV